MKQLRAKIKKTSAHFEMGTNQKGKPIWLSVTGFSPTGEKNFKVKAIKRIKNGFAEYEEVWLAQAEITLKHFDDGQLSLDILSRKKEKRKNIAQSSSTKGGSR